MLQQNHFYSIGPRWSGNSNAAPDQPLTAELVNTRQEFLNRDVQGSKPRQNNPHRRPVNQVGQQRRQKLGKKVELSQRELEAKFQEGVTLSAAKQRLHTNPFRLASLKTRPAVTKENDLIIEDVVESQTPPVTTPLSSTTLTSATRPPKSAKLIEKKIQEIYKDQIFVGLEAATQPPPPPSSTTSGTNIIKLFCSDCTLLK